MAVLPQFVVEMRARRHPGRPHRADHLATRDAHARAHRNPAHMTVGGLVSARMADADIIAIAAVASGELDGAVRGGTDRRAGGRCDVHPLVQAAEAEHRMRAIAEAGRQASLGGHQHALGPFAHPLGIVPHGAAFAFPTHELNFAAALVEACKEQFAKLFFARRGALALDDQVEFVVRADARHRHFGGDRFDERLDCFRRRACGARGAV